MKYLIGIDGGGTKTKCVVTDLNLKPVYECTGGPSNLLINNPDKVSGTILRLLEKCKTKINSDYKNIASIVLGTAGAGRRYDAKNFENSFLSYLRRKKIILKLFHVESDARIALEGAFSGKPGSILISGTGSIMLGKDIKGNIRRVGGFGRFLGDEGSGYSIGRKGLSALSKSYDGRGETTLLSKFVNDNYHISNEQELITAVYNKNFNIALIAPYVIYAAEKDDPVCIKILEAETDELLLHIKAMKKLLRSSFKVALIGSVLSNNNFFSATLIKKINEQMSDVKIVKPENSPAIGAVLIAKELLR